MNTQARVFLFAASLCALSLASCAGSKTTQDVLSAYGDTGGYEATAIATPIQAASASKYAESLGDFDAIKLDEFFGMTLSFGKLKVKQVSKFYLVPRRNTVEIYYRNGANSLCIILGQQSREGILRAASDFLSQQEEKTLVDAKPSAANSFYSGLCDFYWGVASPANGADGITFHTNCKFIDGLPYFVLRIPSALSTTSQNTYSPYEELYFSPAQLRAFCEQIEQDNLQSLVDEIAARAYVY